MENIEIEAELETSELLSKLDIIQEQIELMEWFNDVMVYNNNLKLKDNITNIIKNRIKDWESITESETLLIKTSITTSYNPVKLIELIWDNAFNYIKMEQKVDTTKLNKDLKKWLIPVEVEECKEVKGTSTRFILKSTQLSEINL